MTNRTRHRTEAELKALFEQAVRAIGFYEAQRKEVTRLFLALSPLKPGIALGIMRELITRSVPNG